MFSSALESACDEHRCRSPQPRRLAFEDLEERKLLVTSVGVRFEFDSPGAVSTLAVGQNFDLKVFVKDVRPSPTGLFQGYLNIAYDATLMHVVGATPVGHGDFNAFVQGDTSVPGTLKEIGGVSSEQLQPVPPDKEQVLFDVTFVADKAGTINLTPSLSLDSGKQFTFFGSATAVPFSNLSFTGGAIDVSSGPAVSSIVKADADPNNSAAVHYTVTFNSPVTGVDTTDFAVASAGLTGPSVTSVSPASGPATVYTVTVNTGSGNGLLGLNLIDNDSIKDGSNASLGGPGVGNGAFTGPTYMIDKAPPIVSSITRVNPSPTNAATVTFSVAFSESVTGVDPFDFQLAQTVSGATITSVSGSGSSYTVTVNTGSGSGAIGLNLIDNDSIVDVAGNALGGPGAGNGSFTGQTYAIDKTPPTVSTIVKADADPTGASVLHYTVTFSESVTGVDPFDFQLAQTVSGATISSVSGSGATYTVTVNSGSGSGTIGLNLVDNDSIVDALGNPLGGAGAGNGNFTGAAYTVDKTPPTVSTISRVGASPTSASSVSFAIAFSENVTGVDAADFQLVPTGVTGAAITGVSGSGGNYTVTVNTGSGSGSLGLNLVDNDSIVDPVGNPLGGAGAGNGSATGPVFTIDKSAPSVVSINRVGASPTNAASVSFAVTFDKSVTGVDPTDFQLLQTGVSGATIGSVSGSGANYTVTANTGSGDGALGLNLVDNDSIIDGASNPLGGAGAGNGNFNGQSFTLDRTPPKATSIVKTDADPSAASIVHFTVNFSESVTGVDATDFQLSQSGVSGATIGGVSGSGATYVVTVNTGAGSGTVALNLVDNDSIQDAVANPLGGAGAGNGSLAGPAYSLDRTAPTVAAIAPVGANPTNASSINFAVSFSKNVTGVDVTDFQLVPSGVSGAAITGVSGSGGAYTVTVNTGSGSGALGLNVLDNDSIVDAVGNPLGGAGAGNGAFAGPAVTLDKTSPTITSLVLAGASPTNSASVSFTATFSENVTGVDATDFQLVPSGVTGAAIGSVTGGGSVYTIVVNTGSGNGTLGLNAVDNDSILDAVGNPLGGAGAGNGAVTGPIYTIDKTPPTVVAAARADASPTNAASVSFNVTFSKSVTGVNAADFQLVQTGVSGAAISGVSGGGTSYVVTVNTGGGSGTLGLNVVDDDSIKDAAGNPLGGVGVGNGAFSGQTYALDRTSPLVSSIVKADVDPTGAAAVHYTVTFSKNVTGVDASDFALAVGGGLSGASIASVTGTGAVYTVTATTGAGSGTLGLNVVDDDSIKDATGNLLGGPGAGNGAFTGPQYSLVRPPLVTAVTKSDSDPTAATAVHFAVTFSENVTGVDATDFAPAVAGGVSGASIASVSGSGASYIVTVNSGSGSGSLGLNVMDDDTIKDAGGVPLGGAGVGNGAVTGPIYAVDKTPPVVSTFVKADADPTNAAALHFAITFSENVSGLDAADFALNPGAGVSGATIGGVSGSGASYVVTVNSGSGSGTLGLNLVDNDSIVDAVGNPLGGAGAGNGAVTGPAYTLDRTPPTVSSIARIDTSPTNANTVGFQVIFSRTVTGVDAADFALATSSGVTLAAITKVTGSGNTYFVTVDTGFGSGTLGLNVVDDDTIVDTVGNPLGGAGAGNGNSTGPTYTLVKPLEVVSISRATANPTHAASVQYTVTFSDSVTGVDATDFALAASAGLTGTAISNVSGGGSVYTVTVNTGAGNGTLGLNVVDDDSIRDPMNHPLGDAGVGNGSFTGDVFAVDKTAPTALSINRADANPTGAATVSFNVVFSESVTGVDAGDFALAQAAGLSGAAIANVSGSGANYTVTVNSGSGAGTLGLNLVDNDTIQDAAANPLGDVGAGNGNLTGPVYNVDKVPPTVATIVRAAASPTNAASVSFNVTFSESVIGVDAADFALATSGVTGGSIAGVSGSGANYTVTIGTGSGDGAVGLNLVDNDTILDAVGNPLGGVGLGNGSSTGPVYTLDKTPPTATAIALASPSPTSAATVSFTVNFSESVTGVDAGDFVLAPAAGIAGASITGVSGSGATYTVTVNTGSGDGSLGLNLLDNDSIQDAVGNVLAGAGSGNGNLTGPTFTIDKSAPTALTISRVDASPTNASTVNFTVTFSESVTGVDTSDFALATTGVTGASITGMMGSGASYTVFVNTGSGDGTVGLNLVDNDTIHDLASNALGGAGTGNGNLTGAVYSLDKTPPVALTIDRASSNPTNASTVSFAVTFSESVTGVDAGDFSIIAAAGVSGATIGSITGSGASYTVTVNTGSGDGTLGLNLVDNDSIHDGVSNPLGGAGAGNGSFTGQVYSLQKSPPTVSSINRVGANPTNGGSVTFAVTFSRSVTGVDAGDFALASSAGLTGAAITSVSGSGASYNVVVSAGTGDGALGLNLVDNDTIQDSLGNQLGGAGAGNGSFTGQAFAIDRTAPTVSSMNRATSSPTNASTVSYNVTFNESVTGVDTGDFALVPSAGVTGAAITGVSGSGANYVVTVNTGAGDGALGLNLVDNDSVQDPAGNVLGGVGAGNGSFTGQAFTLDKTPPTVVSITYSGLNPTSNANVSFGVTFSEAVSGVNAADFVLAASGVSGATITNVTGSGANYVVTVNSGSGNGTLGLNLVDDDTIQDSATNPLGGAGAGNGSLVGQTATIDKTPPTVSSINRATSSPTNAGTVSFNVTFSESVAGVDAADFALAASGVTGATITNVTGSGASYVVAVNTGSGDGMLGLNLVDDDTIHDGAGNSLGGAGAGNGSFTGQAYTIDKTPPSVAAIGRVGSNPTNAGTVTFNVTFSENVTGVDVADFALAPSSGVTGAAITSVSGSGATYAVTVNTGSGDGTLGLKLVDNASIVDLATNALGTSAGNGIVFQSFTLDKTPPTVASINRVGTSPTNAGTVSFAVTFSESVTGVDAADFALAAAGVTGASITSVSGSGTSYTVSVNTGTGDGTLGLNLVDNDSVVDVAGNAIGGTGAGNGSFTGQAFTIDKSSPTVLSINRVDASPTSAATVSYTVTFSESVTGVDAADFALVQAGGVSGAAITNVTGSGSVYSVSINTGSGSGTIGLNLVDNDSIVDGTGNALGGTGAGNGAFTGQVYTLDKTSPSATAINRVGASPTNAATVSFAVTFSESVTGVDATDFSLAPSGGISGATITGVSGSGASYTVTVNTGTGDGALGLNLVDDDSIKDAVGNAIGGAGAGNGNLIGQVFTINKSNTASLAGTVFVQDSFSTPLPGATVTLTGTNANSVAVNVSTETDKNGFYQFGSLFPGTYQITETQPGAFLDGAAAAGNQGGTPGTNTISKIALGVAATGTGYNFGERGPTPHFITVNLFLASTPANGVVFGGLMNNTVVSAAASSAHVTAAALRSNEQVISAASFMASRAAAQTVSVPLALPASQSAEGSTADAGGVATPLAARASAEPDAPMDTAPQAAAPSQSGSALPAAEPDAAVLQSLAMSKLYANAASASTDAAGASSTSGNSASSTDGHTASGSAASQTADPTIAQASNALALSVPSLATHANLVDEALADDTLLSPSELLKTA